jgi:hypothetical protein
VSKRRNLFLGHHVIVPAYNDSIVTFDKDVTSLGCLLDAARNLAGTPRLRGQPATEKAIYARLSRFA